MKNAFMTGSRVYGTPGASSDYDVVVRMDPVDAKALLREFGAEDSYPGRHSTQIRVGRLNLIMCLTDESFDAWREGTQSCWTDKPVDRDTAVKRFKALFEKLPADSDPLEPATSAV